MKTFSSSSMTCELCGHPMRVKYTWFKGKIRKRLLVCTHCGNSWTTSETRDSSSDKHP